MYIENKECLIILHQALQREVIHKTSLIPSADEVMKIQYQFQIKLMEDMIVRAAIAIDKFKPQNRF